jgi:hypothetical protein
MKQIDETFSLGNFTIEREFNNVYDIDNDFMKQLLDDTILLVPPKDFDYDKHEEENEAAKRRDEEKKIEDVDKALHLLTKIYQTKKEALDLELRSLDSFTMKVDPNLREAEVEVFVKAVINNVVEQRLEQEKSGKTPIVVQSPGRQEIRVYLHPVKSDPENIDFLVKLNPIADWSLCAFFPKSVNVTGTSHGVTYWSLADVNTKAGHCNSSIKVKNHIALHRNKRGNYDSLELYSFLFNEIVLKAVVNLAQIKRVEHVRSHKQEMESETFSEFYLHLAYPPRYYVSVLKPDIGCDEGFIRSWERVENFMFLRNEAIMRD